MNISYIKKIGPFWDFVVAAAKTLPSLSSIKQDILLLISNSNNLSFFFKWSLVSCHLLLLAFKFNAEWFPQIIESCDISQGALLISLTFVLAGSASPRFIFHSLLSSWLSVTGSIYSKLLTLPLPVWDCSGGISGMRAHF